MIKVTSSFIDQLVVLFWLCRLTTSQSCACLMCFSNHSIEINGQASRNSQLACSSKVLWCCRQCLITFISPTSCEAGTPNDCKTEPMMTRFQHLHCLKVLWRYISFYMFCQAVWQCCFFKKKQFDDCASVCLEAKHVSTARLCACRVTSTSAPSTVQTVASGATDTSEDPVQKRCSQHTLGWTPWACFWCFIPAWSWCDREPFLVLIFSDLFSRLISSLPSKWAYHILKHAESRIDTVLWGPSS